MVCFSLSWNSHHYRTCHETARGIQLGWHFIRSRFYIYSEESALSLSSKKIKSKFVPVEKKNILIFWMDVKIYFQIVHLTTLSFWKKNLDSFMKQSNKDWISLGVTFLWYRQEDDYYSLTKKRHLEEKSWNSDKCPD